MSGILPRLPSSVLPCAHKTKASIHITVYKRMGKNCKVSEQAIIYTKVSFIAIVLESSLFFHSERNKKKKQIHIYF